MQQYYNCALSTNLVSLVFGYIPIFHIKIGHKTEKIIATFKLGHKTEIMISTFNVPGNASQDKSDRHIPVSQLSCFGWMELFDHGCI